MEGVERVWHRRLRWRLRGAWQWPAFLALTLVDAVLPRLAAGGALVLLSGTTIVEGHDPLRAALSSRFAGGDVRWSYREVDPDVYGEELDAPAYATVDRIAVVVLEAERAPLK